MEDRIITFVGDDNWLVMDLYRFLHNLNLLYNRLYVLNKHESKMSNPVYKSLLNDLKNSYDQVKEKEKLTVASISMQSPLIISLEGVGYIVKELRKLYKDIEFKNRQEKHEGELNIELMKIELLSRRIALCKETGFSDDEVKNIFKTFIYPSKRMIASADKNHVKLIRK